MVRFFVPVSLLILCSLPAHAQAAKDKAKSKVAPPPPQFTSLTCKNKLAGSPTGNVGITIHEVTAQWERTQTSSGDEFFISVRGPWVVVAGQLILRNTANTEIAAEFNPDPRGTPAGTSVPGKANEKGVILDCRVN